MINPQRSKNVQLCRCAAIIVAGGSGQRFGGETPKQFKELGTKRVIDWSVDVFASHPAFDLIVVVVPDNATTARIENSFGASVKVTTGGSTRTQSVSNGLDLLPEDFDGLIFIHDAARPGITIKMLDALIDKLQTFDGTAPALPIIDALKTLDSNGVTSQPRKNLYRVQTPQAFRWTTFRTPFAQLRDKDFLDDLEIAEHANLTIGFVPGEERLRKITYPEDLDFLTKELHPVTSFRTGQGFDVHAFADGASLWLCGVEIPHVQKLDGHSDADVAWHALTDAILGAAVAGDIGDHFPPTDEQWKNAPSDKFLRYAAELASEAGGTIVHVDVTIVCEVPKIKPHRQRMRERTAEIIGCEVEQVSVKATTTEKLGFLGRSEGIAAQAVATLRFD